VIELVTRRIAEKALERRATRCKPPSRSGCEADYTLAVEMLLFVGPIAGDLLGDYGQVAWTTFQVAANAIRRGWMTPCQALRFARDALETAVARAAVEATFPAPTVARAATEEAEQARQEGLAC
jgi:hypothetical protein